MPTWVYLNVTSSKVVLVKQSKHLIKYAHFTSIHMEWTGIHQNNINILNTKKLKKPTALRHASWDVYKEINRSSSNIHIGGVLCSIHRNLVEKKTIAEKLVAESADFFLHPMIQMIQVHFIKPPPPALLTHDQKRTVKARLSNLMDTVAPELSPIQYQITPANQLTSNTIRPIKRKYKQDKEGFKK
ncbi:hypothetical protein JTE90_006754 [Oedothorax gibbosus]|uniref:Uncharacterized protein n=1 Tax=Oedothorax gibbosus TaxID=931172 RepID=A0AAV6UM95_9ARAC|nr:hypothetical protein JTE90_006754 [Oedothorax gibbosus]